MTLRSSARTSLRKRADFSRNLFAENFNGSHPDTVKYPDTERPVYRLVALPGALSGKRCSYTIDGRPGGIRTPNQRFWRPPLYQFELLACVKPYSKPGSPPYPALLPGLPMKSVCPAELAVLLEFDPSRIVLLVLHRRIVPALALSTSQCDDLAHEAHLPSSPEKAPENRFINLPYRDIRVKKRAALRCTRRRLQTATDLFTRDSQIQNGAHDRD